MKTGVLLNPNFLFEVEAVTFMMDGNTSVHAALKARTLIRRPPSSG
jgi:hypothetical protein